MKKTRMTTKVLSVLLTAVMLFTTISVGIIMPEAKLEADAATEGATYTVTTIAQINSAIAAANTAGPDVVTTIKLGQTIQYNGSLASFTKITGNVLFDFNGYSLLMNYIVSGAYDSDQTGVQLPSANQGSFHNGKDVFTNGMFMIGAGATMKIINTKPNNICTMQAYTDFTDTRKNSTIDHQTSSSLIYNEGTLIIGDDKNSTYNDFTLYAHSLCRITNGENPNLYGVKSATSNVYTVTLNSSSAVLKMYGGNIHATGAARARRGTYADILCYALNVNECYSAEIYGGAIDIPQCPTEQNNGIFQASSKACEGGTARISAIRCNSPYLYIFDVTSNVQSRTGTDSSKDNNQYTSNIWSTSDANAANVFGGYFYYWVQEGDNSSTANNHGYIARGPFKVASGGTLIPSAVSGSDHLHQNPDQGGTLDGSYTGYTVFVGDNGTAENGIDMFSYNTFRQYLAQHTTALDVYTGHTIMTTNGDAAATVDSTNYLRNGYKHTGWQGKKWPGEAYRTNYSSPNGAGLPSEGGSLYLAPYWTENEYTIHYDWNDEDGASKVTNKDALPTIYKIDSTPEAKLGLPVRHGYTFVNWEVTNYKYPDTDTKKNAWSLATYPAGFELDGKNGDIWIKAHWAPVEYNATFDLNGGNYYGDTSDIVKGYNVNKIFQFPDDIRKDYYNFDNTFKCIVASGSWAANDTLYGAGDWSTVGNWGDPVFQAQFTPIAYTITYDSALGTSVENADVKTYTVEGNNPVTGAEGLTLPAVTRKGYEFGGWYIEDANTILNNDSWTGGTRVDADGNTVPLKTYPAGTALTGKHGNVTLKAYWISSKYTLTLDVSTERNEFIEGDTTLTYAYASAMELNNPTRAGYKFKGWKVIAAPDSGTTWEIGKIYVPDVDGAKVTIPAQQIGSVTLQPVWETLTYTITYNSNGGTYADPYTFTIEDSFNLPVVTRNGYKFVQWVITDKEGNWNTQSSFTEGQRITGMYGNVTLSAEWTTKPYTVTLNANGGTVTPDTLTYTIENNLALPTPLKTGYKFTGWMVTGMDADSSWILGDIYVSFLSNIDLNGDYNYGNVTLEAQWEHQEYNIHFTSDGTVPSDLKYYIDSEAFYLPASSYPGYTFKEWKVATSDGNWTFDERIKPGTALTGRYGNVTLVAVLEANTYTITYKDIDGSENIVSYDMKTAISIPVYEAEGYTFGGWKVTSLENGGGWSYSMRYMPGQIEGGGLYGDVVLEPDLTPTEYEITFIPDGGTPFANISYNITNENSDALPTPEKTGYDFAGWTVTAAEGNWEDGKTYPAGTSLTGKYGTVTLTAKWTPKTYTITWVTGNGTHTTDGTYNEMPSFDGVDTSKPSDAQYTYTFTGWSPSLSTVKGEATYTAQYSKTVNSYTVTWKYETSDTSGYITDTVSYNYGVHPVFNNGANPTKTSSSDKFYRFVGWVDANGNYLTADTVVTGDVTYTAEFKEVEAPRTVTWIINGVRYDTMWGVDEIPSYAGTPIKPDSNGNKYEFSHWEPEITVVVAGKDYEYTAVFAESARNYTASFDLNGGEYSGDTEVTYNKADGLTMPKPTKEGYTFAGWRVVSNGGTWTNTDLLTYSKYAGLWGDVSFVAEYTAIEYTIREEKDDGTIAEHKYTIESTGTLPAPSKDGFVLTGWMIVSAEGNWIAGDTVAADKALSGMFGNVTIHPLWTAKLYKITWVSGEITQTSEFKYGDPVVAYPPLAKAGFTAAWDKTVPNVMPAEDLTFTAVYSPIQYYLRFNTAGGSTVENFYYDTTTDTVLPTPTRDGATFKGWKVSAGNGSWLKGQVYDGGAALKGTYGNATLTAQWELQTYEVKWVIDEENNVVKVSRWYHGAIPSYDGTPVKASDEMNSYKFIGWDKEIVAVTEDVVYTAQFEATERIYTVKWNVDGFVITQTYKFGETPVYTGSAPVRPSTQEYDFTFAGWSPEVSAVSGDITYIAQFEVFTKLLGLRVDKSAVFLNIGENAVVSAIVSPSTATNKDVDWISSDETIATVDEMGKITAVGAGDTLIRVQSKDGAFKSYCVVSVAPVITEYVVISAGGVSTTRLPGEAIQLTATVMPENATNKKVTWTSSNTSVAMVDSSGLVIFGEVLGTAVITATTDGYGVGTIEVRTTDKVSEVEDSVKTYLVMFSASTSDFIIAGNTYESVNIVYKEGDTVEFLLTEPHFAMANGVKLEREADGVYRIYNISKNYSIMTVERADIGLEEDKDEPQKLSFFEKLKQFFRSIVEFFRGLFGG